MPGEKAQCAALEVGVEKGEILTPAPYMVKTLRITHA
jgi:hypothetical protein